ncbi:hypothetical protein AAHE18_18G117900 [Arachis hypogaea]
MAAREILHKMKEKVGLRSSEPDSGKGKSKISRRVTHGFHLVKGRSYHAMEDFVVAEFKQVDSNELGLFAIFDGHAGHNVPNYLRSHLFENILKEPDFWKDPENAVRRAYSITDSSILEKSGLAKQLSEDHEPHIESEDIKNRGGFVSKFPGDVPRVDGRLAVSRAFGDKSLKKHLSSEPHVTVELVQDDVEFLILASDGLWKVMTNQEAVNTIKDIKDARSSAKRLTEEALNRKSTDDISCIVVKFQ